MNWDQPRNGGKGSTMFPRDRVMASLKKYNIAFEESLTDEQLRGLLADFYAKRTLTHQAIDPKDCAEAILFLASPKSRCTTWPFDSRGWQADRSFHAMSGYLQNRALVAIDLGRRAAAYRCCAGTRARRKSIWSIASPMHPSRKMAACVGISVTFL